MVYDVEDAVLKTKLAQAELSGDAAEQARARGEIAVTEIRRRLAEEERAIEDLRVRLEKADSEERERLQRMLDYRVQIAEETRKQLEIAERQIVADGERAQQEKAKALRRERGKRSEER